MSDREYKRFAGQSVNNAGYHNHNWDLFHNGNELRDVSFPSLAAALKAIGSSQKTLYITTQHRITRSLTIPDNISLHVLQGGSFNVASGQVLTIPQPEAGNYQIFYGLGTVVSRKGRLNVFWWGAKGDGITDDYAPMQKTITQAQTAGIAVYIPSGARYRITQNLAITSSLTVYSDSIAGPRVFSGSSTLYGGPEIYFDASPSDRFAKASYALSIDTGSVGSEGFAQTRIRGIGISWSGLHAGGIYIEGAVDVGIEDCWLTGGLSNYGLGTQTGFGIYCLDAIVSKFTANTFRYMAYAIVAENYWNENVINENDFYTILDTCILLRGKDVASVRSTIAENNFISAKSGVKVCGNTNAVTIRENTFEIMTHNPIQATGTDPLDATSNGTPSNIRIRDNAFLACNGGVAGPHIQLLVDYATVSGNAVRNPAGGTTALVNVSSGSTGTVEIRDNDPDALTLATGDATVMSGISGTFTPALAFGGASVGITYAAATARYRKIEKNLVHVQGQIALSAKGSSTGNMTITGLPFVSENIGNLYCAPALRANNLTGITGNLQGALANNSQVIAISFLGTGALTNLTDANATNTTSFYFELTYRTT